MSGKGLAGGSDCGKKKKKRQFYTAEAFYRNVCKCCLLTKNLLHLRRVFHIRTKAYHSHLEIGNHFNETSSAVHLGEVNSVLTFIIHHFF